MRAEFWGLVLVVSLGVAAVAARVLWVANWFPPPADWSRRRKVVVWVVFVAGMAGFALWVFIVSRHSTGPAA
jgi:hypothetical protein